MKVKLEEVCKRIYAGGDVPKDRYSEVKTDQYQVPIYANAEKDEGLYGYTDVARENDLSITVAARGTIGYTAIRKEPFLPVVRLITVVPDTDKISVRYLYYALRNCKPQSSGTSIPQLTVPDIKKNYVHLYGIKEQERIADVLDKAQGIIDVRKKELEQLDNLIKARFVEMFEGKYKTIKIGDKFDTTSGGTPSKSHPEYYENGTIPWLSSGEVNLGVIYSVKNHITQAGVDNSSAKMVPENSVVIAMYGATAGQVGLLRIATTTNQAVCSVLPNGRYVPEYLYYAIKAKKDWMISQCAGGAQPNISQGVIKRMEIIDATYEMQQQFVTFVKHTDKSKFLLLE